MSWLSWTKPLARQALPGVRSLQRSPWPPHEASQARIGAPLREALVELMSAAELARRVGTNLNQAVARLNAMGQRGEDLLPAVQFCMRVIRRLDEAAEHVRRNVP